MSGEAYVDPARLRQFAEELGRTLGDYDQAIELLKRRLGGLGSSWRDQEFGQFADEVGKTERILREFIEEGHKARAAMLRDADAAEAYQSIRPPG